ncbi:MAG: hypothetical protein WC587_00785 [Candidatus Paceibacterota bacterium]
MKKFLPYILITVVVATLVLGPFGAPKANAEDPVPPPASSPAPVPPPASSPAPIIPTTAGAGSGLENVAPSGWACAPLPKIFDLQECIASIMYYAVVGPSGVVLWISGQIFNLSVSFSLSGETLKQDFVSTGWAVTRDVANLFFIFILLYIAIATILQLSGYGMKELLVTVIILALLINFSLVITRFIIDGSNILALEFYNEMPSAEQGSVTQSIFGADAKDVSSIFISGFNPQNIFDVKRFNDWTKSGSNILFMIIIFLCSIIINLIASFILLAGAVLFIIRIAVLWIIMILAPLAFLAMALPATKTYASQWWKKLFEQAFFAPAFLFMLYMTAHLVKSGFLKGKNLPGGGSMPAESFFGSLVIILLYFFVVAVFLVASLIIAKQMGAEGASTVQKWGQSAKKWGQGQAGRISRRGAGKMAEGMLNEESWINKKTGGKMARFANLPIIGRGFAKVSSLEQKEKKKQEGEYDKHYGSYSNAGLQAVLNDPTLSEKRKAAAKRVMAKRGDMEKEKKELEQLEQVLPHLESMAPGFEQKIKDTDSDLEPILTDITATEYKLAEAVKQGNTGAINLAKSELNILKKTKAQNLIERQKAVEGLSEIKEHKGRKEKLVEKRERRGETAGLQASIGGIRTGGGGGSSTP